MADRAAPLPPEDDFDPDDGEPLDEEEMLDMDCGLMANGQCRLAGTEFCDWECGRLDDAR